jgi:hypothetical protein
MTSGMTSVPWAPVQVATQVYLLAAQSAMAEGSVRPEVVGVLLTSGSNRAGWLHGGLATHRDRTTATRSAKPC